MMNGDLEYYHVLRDKVTGELGCYFTDRMDPESFMSEFDEDLAGKEEVPFEEWPVDMVAEVFGDVLEDRNHHRWVHLPVMIAAALKEEHVPEAMQANVMRRIFEKAMGEIL